MAPLWKCITDHQIQIIVRIETRSPGHLLIICHRTHVFFIKFLIYCEFCRNWQRCKKKSPILQWYQVREKNKHPEPVLSKKSKQLFFAHLSIDIDKNLSLNFSSYSANTQTIWKQIHTNIIYYSISQWSGLVFACPSCENGELSLHAVEWVTQVRSGSSS